MANTKDQTGGGKPARPGIAGELSQMRSNGTATADELREFLGTLKGKSPQEVLGVVAQSGLTRGIVHSTIGFAVLLVVFSILPYGYHKMWPSEAAAATAAETEAPVDNENADDTANTENAAVTAADASTGSGDLPDKLGIGETKASDPKSNPLDSDNKLDNLLDGVD